MSGRFDFFQGKADLEFESKKGCTALLYSSRGSYNDIVEFLLQNKANANHKDKAGTTALHHAIEKGNTQTVAV